ncbi:hypothetical protein [Klugiella xanthotipulae]|uniref:hypothetical protein n=1 Tax=Klugiella xanthotipulae TaxID=244735 RepID=UPI0031DC7D5D
MPDTEPKRSRKRVSRRVVRPAVPGTDERPQGGLDPTLASEDSDESWGDRAEGNDGDLLRNRPPHWG